MVVMLLADGIIKSCIRPQTESRMLEDIPRPEDMMISALVRGSSHHNVSSSLLSNVTTRHLPTNPYTVEEQILDRNTFL